MDATLSKLGVGALLAWVALPIFAWLVRPRVRPDAVTLHRAQLAILTLAIALFVLPWLPVVLPAWLAPKAPYYSFELRAVFAPVAQPLPFEAPPLATALSPMSFVGAAWLIAVGIAVTRIAMSARALDRLLASAYPASQELLEIVKVRAAAKRIPVPRVLISERSAIPFATGLAAPFIVLPWELVESLDLAALELVIEHELEHVRRGDVRAAALVTAFKVVLGGHPTAERIAREAGLAREIAVDAHVARENARAYATLLVDIASHAHFGEKPAATAIDDTALARRIALISEPMATRPLSLWPAIAGALAISMLALLASTLVDWSPGPPRLFTARMAGPLFMGRQMAGVPGPGSAAMVIGHHVAAGVGMHVSSHGPHGVFAGAVRGLPAGVPPPPGPELPMLIEQSPEVRACYAKVAGADHSLAAHASIALEVDPQAAVSVSVTVPDSPPLAACLEGAVKRVVSKLDMPAGTSVMIGLEFSPETMPL